MQRITVKSKDSNTKIDKYLLEIYPNLSYSTLQKTFRKKDIKVNSTRINKDYVVKTGDVLEIYITDDLLDGLANSSIDSESMNSSANRPNASEGRKSNLAKESIVGTQSGFTIVYEDNNLLVVNKAQGVPVHPDKNQLQNTLIDQVRIYLNQCDNQLKENCPPLCPPSRRKDSFQPSLCHRLDRNTGGLVIIAKNQLSYNILLNKVEAGEIRKYYKCLVKGRLKNSEAQLKAYLWKDARKSRVFVSNQKSKGALGIITSYKVLEYEPSIDVSMLEVELITGRTHQIRAHMAFIGHPILGDGKYGTNTINRMFGLKTQALWAYKLSFNFNEKSSLDYLNGKVLTVEPEFDIKHL